MLGVVRNSVSVQELRELSPYRDVMPTIRVILARAWIYERLYSSIVKPPPLRALRSGYIRGDIVRKIQFEDHPSPEWLFSAQKSFLWGSNPTMCVFWSSYDSGAIF